MAEKTGISWAHHSWNPWVVRQISPGCAHCYIHRVMTKQGRESWGEIYRTKTWADPDKWQKKAEKARQVERVFSCSMSDFFHAKADCWRDEAWEVIKRTPNLVYFLLTKRPARIVQHLPKDWETATRTSGWVSRLLASVIFIKWTCSAKFRYTRRLFAV